MDNLKKIYDRISELAATRSTDLDEIKAKIETQKALAASAADEAAKAFDNEDVKAYHVAQDKQRSAYDAIKMLEARLEKVEEAPRLSSDEYAELVNQINAEFDTMTDTARAKIAEHVAAIAALKPGITEAFQTGEKALHALQFEVMNDAPHVVNAHGQKVPVAVGEKHLKGFSFMDEVIKAANDQLVDAPRAKF